MPSLKSKQDDAVTFAGIVSPHPRRLVCVAVDHKLQFCLKVTIQAIGQDFKQTFTLTVGHPFMTCIKNIFYLYL